MSQYSPRRLALFLGLLFAALGFIARPALAADTKKPHVVVAMFTKDTARQELLMRNLQNLRKERPQATIEVVAFGPGLSLVTQKVDGKENTLGKSVASLAEGGVKFLACANTMRAMNVKKEDLLPKVGIVPSGIVHVIDRQQEGWAYFAP